MAEKKELSAALKDTYKMKAPHEPGIYHFKGKKIDLTSCDLATAEEAVKKGMDVIVPIKSEKPVVKQP